VLLYTRFKQAKQRVAPNENQKQEEKKKSKDETQRAIEANQTYEEIPFQ
jgi:hypothetical protein